jgi:hypothetical protein
MVGVLRHSPPQDPLAAPAAASAWSPARKRRMRRQRKQATVKATSITSMLQEKSAQSSISDLCQLYLTSTAAKSEQKAASSRQAQHIIWTMAQRNVWSDDITNLVSHVAEMSVDPHWNFFVQHMVTLCNSHQLDFICLSLRGQADELARHSIGCRVLSRICEQACASQEAMELLTEVSRNLLDYVDHKNANYVVSKLLENFDSFPGMDEVIQSCTSRPSLCCVCMRVLYGSVLY